MLTRPYCGNWDRDSLDYMALVNEWHVVARGSDIADAPVASTLLGERLVLWRSHGEIAAWADHCPHRGAPLSLGRVADGRLSCPYHGWAYGGDGRRVEVPAHPELRPTSAPVVTRFSVAERYGFVWVSLGEGKEIPRLPHWDTPAYRKCQTGPYTFGANALRCMDNFMDASHFPYVHSGINGRPEIPDVTIDYRVLKTPDGLATTGFQVVQPDADARGIQLLVRYQYYCLSPTVAYSDKETSPDEHWFTWAAVTPIDVDRSLVWLVICFNHKAEISQAAIQRRQSRIFEDGDRKIVESQRPIRMPLEPADELHVKSDRLGLAYRQWIKCLGEEAQRRHRDSP